jgi:hypothetical protein
VCRSWWIAFCEDKSRSCGLGVDVVIDSVGSYGWGGAANTRFWIDPQENLIGLPMLKLVPRGNSGLVALDTRGKGKGIWVADGALLLRRIGALS